jgi:hypothetical protein
MNATLWLTGICLAFFAVGLVAFIASIIEEVAEIIRRGGCGQASKVLPGMGEAANLTKAA